MNVESRNEIREKAPAFLKGLQSFFGVAILFVSVSPYQRFMGNHIFVILVSTWLLLSFLIDGKHLARSFLGRESLWLYLWALFLMVSMMLGHAKFPVRVLMLTFVFQMFWYYSADTTNLKRQVVFVLVYFLLIGLWTIVKLIGEPRTARFLAGASFSEAGLFVGGYGFTYSVTFLIPMIIHVLISDKMKEKRSTIFLIFLVIVLTGFLIMAQYMIAILLCAFATCGVLLFRKPRTKRFYLRLLLFVLLFVSSLFFLTESYISFFDALERKMPSLYIFTSKSKEIIMNMRRFTSGEIVGNVGSRIDLYKISWITFSRSPVLGIGSIERNVELIGEHSLWLDLMARYGLIGLCAFLAAFGTNALRLIRITRSSKLLIPVYLLYALFLLVNTGMELEDGAMMFYIIPSILITLNKQNLRPLNSRDS